MKPVKQTRVGRGGNCFQACVASLLEMELGDVPDFCNEHKDTWFLSFCSWLRQFGMTATMVKYASDGPFLESIKDVPVMVGGQSALRPHMHEVIYMNNQMVHDPAPEGKGLKEPEDVILIVCLNPAKMLGAQNGRAY